MLTNKIFHFICSDTTSRIYSKDARTYRAGTWARRHVRHGTGWNERAYRKSTKSSGITVVFKDMLPRKYLIEEVLNRRNPKWSSVYKVLTRNISRQSHIRHSGILNDSTRLVKSSVSDMHPKGQTYTRPLLYCQMTTLLGSLRWMALPAVRLDHLRTTAGSRVFHSTGTCIASRSRCVMKMSSSVRISKDDSLHGVCERM